MRMGDIINGYTILEDFKVTGGMSMVSFAKKNGKEYFIKEFLSPKYPTPDSPGSERIKEQKRKSCDVFEKHHRDLNTAIEKCVGKGGNLIYALDFFRFGASYYKITEKVDVSSLSTSEISKLPIKSILLIAKSAAHSIGILHKEKIVHGDLKPDNLLIKKKSDTVYVTKLIDFDDSYFESRPPEDKDNLVGTPEYYSPEQASYIMDEDDEVEGSVLTCKSDIFSLGIIFTEYFTGTKPIITGDYKSIWNCVQNKGSVSFKGSLVPDVERLLRRMLSLRPADRPTINEVLSALKNVDITSKGRHHEGGTTLRIGRGFGPTIKPISYGEGKALAKDTKTTHDSPIKTPTKTEGEPVKDVKDIKMINHLRGKGMDIASK